MKMLSTLLSMSLTLTAHAGLMGKIKGHDESRLSVSILDYDLRKHVGINIYLDVEGEQGYSHISFYMPIGTYHTIFNSGENTEGEYKDMSTRILYSAIGPKEERDIVFEKQFLNDSGRFEIAMKEIVHITLRNSNASIGIEAFRRELTLFYVGELESVAHNTVDNMTIERDGVWLYSDNTSFPLGKVVTIEGLKAAGENTSTKALLEACEAECGELEW